MRWTRLLSVDARSLLRDNHQILTAFIEFARTYCSPMMVNLKCASMYGSIGGLREHDIVLGEVAVRGGCKCFRISPDNLRNASPRDNFEAVLPALVS